MYLDGKRVLVAGATGLAGRSILRHLLRYCPRTRIRAVFHEKAHDVLRDRRLEHVRADLCRLRDCRRVAKGCDSVFMAAAQTGGAQAAVLEPWRQVTDNAVMNAHILQACHDTGIRRIVCAGSATLYQPQEGPVREEDLKLDCDPYPSYFGIGWVTRFVEKLCRFWHEKTGLEVVLARCANIYGPFARFDPARANFIPALVRKAVDKMDPFEVWGSADVARDVIYADDFASAVVAMMNAAEIRFDVFNVGSGKTVTVGDAVTWALAGAGHAPRRIVYRDDKPVTIRSRILDITKAMKLLGWKPEVGPREGIAKTVAWWQQNRRHWKR